MYLRLGFVDFTYYNVARYCLSIYIYFLQTSTAKNQYNLYCRLEQDISRATIKSSTTISVSPKSIFVRFLVVFGKAVAASVVPKNYQIKV